MLAGWLARWVRGFDSGDFAPLPHQAAPPRNLILPFRFRKPTPESSTGLVINLLSRNCSASSRSLNFCRADISRSERLPFTMAALDNANPTILSASQLPTRQSKKVSPRAGPDSKYSDVIFARPSYLEKPFNVNNGNGVLPGSRPTSNDDAGEDAIDEQEIYGTFEPNL